MSLGAIAAGHEETLESAEEILKTGGNAFDAAIAGCFTLFAAEPCMGSAGAGGFAMCHSVEDGTHLLDFFTQSPREKDLERTLDFRPIEVDFGTETEVFHIGKASIAVPGVIAGLFSIHERYGTLPMSELIQHAQHAAKRGVRVNAFGEIDTVLLKEILWTEPSVRNIFFNGEEPKKENDTMVFPHYPDFLDFIASEGSTGFYAGEIGAKVSEEVLHGGGFLTRADFENYEARWCEPMRMPYRGNTLCLPNGPSLGGAIMALLLHHAKEDQFPLSKLLLHVKEEIHERGALAKYMQRLLPDLCYSYQGSHLASKGTTHFSVIDKHGNSIAFTTSIGEGSGYWIPGTDMQMNNMLGEAFLIPDGHHTWKPDQRINSMMTPVMVISPQGRIAYSGGSGGAGRIPYMIYQVLEAIYEKGLPLEDATLFPRQHWHERVLNFEAGADLTGILEGRAEQCWDEHSLFFGGVHSILQDDQGNYRAAGDPRRFGVSKVLD